MFIFAILIKIFYPWFREARFWGKRILLYLGELSSHICIWDKIAERAKILAAEIG